MSEQTTNATKEKFFKRHKVLTVLGLLFIIGLIGSAGSTEKPVEEKKASTTSKTESKPVEKAKEESKIGTAVRDGKFEFVVKSVECGKTSVGQNEYLTKTPQGQFCALNMSVKNIGDEAQSLFSSNQKLLNEKGQKFTADDTATIYASSSDGSSWYSNINPGNTVEGSIIFDMPNDQLPTVAVLHDSMYSSGVKVSLK